MVATAAAPATRAAHGEWPWLRGRGWDLTFIVFSAGLVGVPLIAHYGLGVSTQVVNYVIAGLVGGPHMYATYTLTFWEPSSWRRRRWQTAGALLIPVAVIALTIVNLSLLVTIFLGWASFHVLQQIAYLSDCYRVRAGEPLWGRARAIDYAVIFLSLYPIAMYKLATNSFRVGKDAVYEFFPAFLKTDLFIIAVWSVFFAAVALWLAKTVHEYRECRLNYTKTLLIGVTVVISFIIPIFDNLDVAFQGMNTWHSLQYVALLWYVNALRRARGEIANGLIRRIAGEGRARQFYLFHVGLTVIAGAVIVLLYGASAPMGLGLSFQQCYFMVVLSFLLMHYYFDTILFTRVDVAVPEFRDLMPRPGTGAVRPGAAG
jgi:hypothetical protein